MPLLAVLIKGLFGSLLGLLTALVGAKAAVRIAAATTLAGIYISCVLMFTNLVAQWIGMVFNTAYGQILGLLFPPISGTVVVSLFAYFTCVAGARYVKSLTKLAIG